MNVEQQIYCRLTNYKYFPSDGMVIGFVLQVDKLITYPAKKYGIEYENI